MEQPPGQTVAAVSEGVIVGPAKMGPNWPGRGSHVATASFLVDPARQGKGVGRALGEHVLDWCRSAGFASIQFNAVVESNAPPCIFCSRLASRSPARYPNPSITPSTAWSACTSCTGPSEAAPAVTAVSTGLTKPPDLRHRTTIIGQPRDLVFRAYTDPELLMQWLGPRDLAMSVERYDVRDGGQWRYVHTDARGNTYGFHGVFHGDPSPQAIVQTFEFEGAPGHVKLDTRNQRRASRRVRAAAITQAGLPRLRAPDSGRYRRALPPGG